MKRVSKFTFYATINSYMSRSGHAVRREILNPKTVGVKLNGEKTGGFIHEYSINREGITIIIGRIEPSTNRAGDREYYLKDYLFSGFVDKCANCQKSDVPLTAQYNPIKLMKDHKEQIEFLCDYCSDLLVGEEL